MNLHQLIEIAQKNPTVTARRWWNREAEGVTQSRNQWARPPPQKNWMTIVRPILLLRMYTISDQEYYIRTIRRAVVSHSYDG